MPVMVIVRVFSINRGKSPAVPFFWIPAFAGMTDVYSIMTDTYSVLSFPRTRESRTCYRDLLRCYLKLTKSFLFYGTPRLFNLPSAMELSLQEGIFLPQNPN